jgi:hypothetical protein
MAIQHLHELMLPGVNRTSPPQIEKQMGLLLRKSVWQQSEMRVSIHLPPGIGFNLIDTIKLLPAYKPQGMRGRDLVFS